MRKSRFTEEQMVRILREAEAPGTSVVEVARLHKENLELRLERELLKNAAFFAKER